MANINLKDNPFLIRLLDEGEDPEEGLRALMALPPEKLLMRWVNYQL